jgi:hypothetical protein
METLKKKTQKAKGGVYADNIERSGTMKYKRGTTCGERTRTINQ